MSRRASGIRTAIVTSLWLYLSLSLSGTTCLVALLSDKELTVANVGDSRGVLCDKDGNAIPMSHDHKPYQLKERKRIKKAGDLEHLRQIFTSALRNRLSAFVQLSKFNSEGLSLLFNVQWRFVSICWWMVELTKHDEIHWKEAPGVPSFSQYDEQFIVNKQQRNRENYL